MPFLAALLKPLLDWVLDKLILFGGWVFSTIDKAMKKVRKQKLIKEKADQSVEPLKKAKTAQEVDDAAKDALDNI